MKKEIFISKKNEQNEDAIKCKINGSKNSNSNMEIVPVTDISEEELDILEGKISGDGDI